MTARIAVVAGHYDGSEWSEESLATRRLAGALACEADVDVLIADGDSSIDNEGAVRVLRFPADRPAPERRAAYLRAAFGCDDPHGPRVCGCGAPVFRALAFDLPAPLQRRIADLIAPPSPQLVEHLANESYDVIVAAGYAAGLRVADVSARHRVLVPLARDEPAFHLPIFDRVFAAADRLVVFSDAEASLVRRRFRSAAPIENVRFALRAESPPADSAVERERRRFVIARDWRSGFAFRWLARLARAIGRRLADADLALVGPGAAAIPEMERVIVGTVRSRRDVERWIRGVTALVDPEPHRLLGREVIEAMALGTPVVVPASGGATRDLAEASDGGLWYRSDAELVHCLETLGDSDVASALGRRGRAHAERQYGDPDEFIRRVNAAVLAAAR